MKMTTSIFIALTVMSGLALGQQQQADPDFDAKVSHPSYGARHPKILFDEAHHNFHTATGRYKPFADLITNDGYRVVPNKEKFSKGTLADFDILVIANALAGKPVENYWTPAFTDEECDAVRDWVRAGGSLLLIADHAPFGAGAEKLAARFGVQMSKGFTSDPVNDDPVTKNPTFLLFSRDNHLLVKHPITEGRGRSEQVNRVITFTGQSLRGPEGSVAFLKLADTAIDQSAPTEAAIREAVAQAEEEAKRAGKPAPQDFTMPVGAEVSAAGRAQGIALYYGKGRVVVLGEAALLSAQVGRQGLHIGMNRADADDRRLGLNIMHWLSGLLN